MRVRHPELVLAAATALSLPMVPSILDGAISPAAALVRYLAAILLCWAGGAVVAAVVRRYAVASRRTELERAIQGRPEEGAGPARTRQASRSEAGVPK